MNFEWNPDKNQWLVANRGITFEEIIHLINEGFLLAILEHKKRTNQIIFVVQRNQYAFNIPAVKTEQGAFFLKTIYPSRVSTKIHCRQKS